MKKYFVTMTVDTEENVTWEDVESAIKNLIFDNPNFTVGCITAKEIKMPNWCNCEEADIVWDGFGGGTCKICGGDTF